MDKQDVDLKKAADVAGEFPPVPLPIPIGATLLPNTLGEKVSELLKSEGADKDKKAFITVTERSGRETTFVGVLDGDKFTATHALESKNAGLTSEVSDLKDVPEKNRTFAAKDGKVKIGDSDDKGSNRSLTVGLLEAADAQQKVASRSAPPPPRAEAPNRSSAAL
jgi:hypothetical protein